jgi:hypothetical protein
MVAFITNFRNQLLTIISISQAIIKNDFQQVEASLRTDGEGWASSG